MTRTSKSSDETVAARKRKDAKTRKALPSKAVAKPHEPTPQESTAVEAFHAREDSRIPAPRVKITRKGGVAEISVCHEDQGLGAVLLSEALGITEPGFLDGLIDQLANAGTRGRDVDEVGVNFMLSMVQGVEPRDQVEAMLAAQMAAVHCATMTFARRLNHVDNIAQQNSAANAFNKLARTFSAQMEALKRYRTGGEQKVTVTHVTVNEGGQAVVGHITAGGRGAGGNQEPTS